MTDPAEKRNILRLLLEAAVVVVFALLIWNNFALRRQVHAVAASVREHAFVARDGIVSVPTIDLAGKPGTLDLQSGRTLLAIVDPRCDSCRAMIATIHDAPSLRVLSLAPVDETRAMAGQFGLTAVTSVLGKPLPKRIALQIQIYPQLLIVDRGKVVRTCATFAECEH